MAGDEEQRPAGDTAELTRRGRAAGCLSVTLMIGAVPAVGLGLLIYLSSARSASANSGIGGALSGLGELVGLGLIAFAVVLFVVGAILLGRSARS